MADRTDVPAIPRSVPEDAVAAVFARAAELDVELSPGAVAPALDEEALVEIGGAVGLSAAAVRRAVAEHHAGALVPAPAVPTTWVGPRLAVAERRLEGDARTVRRTVEHDLERQWFRMVRDHGGRSAWVPRTDIPARVARRVDFRHRLVLKGVAGIAVTSLDCGHGEAVVRIEADPAERRNDLGWAVGAATAGGAVLGAVLAEIVNVDLNLLMALPTAGLGGGGGVALARRSYLAQVLRLTEDLAGLLDRVETTGR